MGTLAPSGWTGTKRNYSSVFAVSKIDIKGARTESNINVFINRSSQSAKQQMESMGSGEAEDMALVSGTH